VQNQQQHHQHNQTWDVLYSLSGMCKLLVLPLLMLLLLILLMRTTAVAAAALLPLLL
jgi:hypothetical protein